MSADLHRRNFLGLSLASSSGLAFGGTSLIELLNQPNAVATVHGILKEYLDVKDADLEVVARFVASLKASTAHTESPAHFAQLLLGQKESDELSTYVVQEFIVSSNYLAVRAGEQPKLENLSLS